MSIQTIEFFEVGDHYAEDGSGPFKIIGRLWNNDEANAFAKGRGNYGSDAQVKPVKLIISDTVGDQENYLREEFRQKALDKLSYEEKVALGLLKK